MTPERPWSVTVRVDEVPESGRHVSLEASEETRAALAGPAGVDAVERLSATFDLTRRGRDGLHVQGRVNATVRQTCVVSLEPMVNTIDEAVDVDFAPPREGEQSADPTKSSSIRAPARSRNRWSGTASTSACSRPSS